MTRFRLMTAALLAGAALTALTSTAHAGDLTVSPQWLAAHLNDPDLVVLHVGERGPYDRKHIAGARFVSLDDIAVDSDGLSLQIPQPADLKARLEKLGISDRSRIVVYYGQNWISEATRVVFTLYAAGLGNRVSLLDGSLAQWTGPVSDKAPAATVGHLSDLRMQPVVVDLAFVKAHLTAPGYAIVDARARVYYDGLQPGGSMMHMKLGRIPGARSLPYTSFNNDDLTMKTPDQARALFAAAGIKPGDHVIAYCHIGQQATEVLFAAREAGIDAVLYDGSFEDWAMHNQPVTTGK
jgi:thiosulfate/3-mercaptopyruvate sulfurtransferase